MIILAFPSLLGITRAELLATSVSMMRPRPMSSPANRMATWCGQVKYIRNGNKRPQSVQVLGSCVSLLVLLLIQSLILTSRNLTSNMLDNSGFRPAPKTNKGPGKPFPIACPGAGWDASATFARTLAEFCGTPRTWPLTPSMLSSSL